MSNGRQSQPLRRAVRGDCGSFGSGSRWTSTWRACPPRGPSWAHRAGPSSDTSEDGWECDGWRRELGDSEVAESYMDAKFGGEGADMVEIVGGW